MTTDMRAGIYIILLGLLMITSACNSQQTVLAKAEKKENLQGDTILEGNFKIIDRDKLGNIYLVTNNNRLIQLDKQNKELFRYSARGLGELSTIDVTNPQKILLYYSQYQNLIFLDNTLSEIQRLNLQDLGFWDVRGATTSLDNNIWIYDPVIDQLLKITGTGEVVLKSNESYTTANSVADVPTLKEIDKKVYLSYNNRFREYDNFAHELRTIKFPHTNLDIRRDQIFYQNGGKIFTRDLIIRIAPTEDERLLAEVGKINDFIVMENNIWYVSAQGLILLRL